ncbi:MAG: TrkA C-terminal domain-containing protein [Pleurocapsa sp. MO_226.B13]|nr:TrkA C-terminal domain-containing protein [Pleurocapsa sp. MO_226.B13]
MGAPFTGAGFTTSESEQVVAHPVRRRILMWSMLLGNAGIVTVISSLVLTFIITAQPLDWVSRILILILGLSVLWILATNRWFNRYITRGVKWGLRRWTKLDVRDYANLLQLQGEYQVKELQVESQDWLANKQLQETHLRDEGVLVLGIIRANGNYVGAPKGFTEISPGDLLIL